MAISWELAIFLDWFSNKTTFDELVHTHTHTHSESERITIQYCTGRTKLHWKPMIGVTAPQFRYEQTIFQSVQ